MPQDLNPKDFDVAVRVAMAIDKIIFDPNVSKQLVAMMQGQPANALARAAVTVLGILQDQSKGQPPRGFGGFVPIIVKRLAELAQAARRFQVTPQIIQQAVQLASQTTQQQAAQPQQNEQPQRGLIGAAMQGA